MKTFRELTEAKETIVFAFGRFNPPTTGHEKLIEACKKVAGSMSSEYILHLHKNQQQPPYHIP